MRIKITQYENPNYDPAALNSIAFIFRADPVDMASDSPFGLGRSKAEALGSLLLKKVWPGIHVDDFTEVSRR